MYDVLHNMDWVSAVRSDYLTPVFRALSSLGGGGFLLVFLVFGYLAIDKVAFARALAVVLVGALINGWLKTYFQDPRPPQALWLDASVGDSYGFPSGHAQVAVALWLWFAAHVRQRWGAILLATLAAGIAVSRLYLGVHDLEDVLGGAAIGFVLLGAFLVWSSERFSDARRRYAVLPLAAAVTLTAMCLATWPGADVRPPLIYGCLLCAFWVGYRLEVSRVSFRPGRLSRAALAGAAGVLGMGALIGSLAMLDNGGAIRAIPATLLVGLYISLLAPMLMVRVGLLEREGSSR
jgi:membrane-associated phospholipid phosphatase